jgi:hypothetical protein
LNYFKQVDCAFSRDVLDGPTAVGDQEVGDDEAVALGNSLLGTQETERLGEIGQPAHEQSPSAIEQVAVRAVPVIEIKKHVSQLEDRPIKNSAIGEKSLDALFGCARPDVGAHTRTIGANAHVGDRTYSMLDQKARKVFGQSAAIAYGVKLHGAAEKLSRKWLLKEEITGGLRNE